jgi:DNA-binding IclR family transcriptional regulator
VSDEPKTEAELRLLEHLQRTAPHPAIREPGPMALERLAKAVGLDPGTCRAALHGLEASGRIALRIHDDGLVEAHLLPGPTGDSERLLRPW